MMHAPHHRSDFVPCRFCVGSESRDSERKSIGIFECWICLAPICSIHSEPYYLGNGHREPYHLVGRVCDDCLVDSDDGYEERGSQVALFENVVKAAEEPMQRHAIQCCLKRKPRSPKQSFL